MQSSAKNSDKFASVMMVAFLVMGSAHFACRYDIGTAIEIFFQKASAETIMPQNSTNDSSVANTAMSEQGIISKSIVRNPFLMPVSAVPNPTQPAQTSASPVNSYAPSNIVATVPLAEPQLRGIISKGNKYFAIIEYQGVSNYYAAGQCVGNYTIININSKSVTISGSANSLDLYVGGNDK